MLFLRVFQKSEDSNDKWAAISIASWGKGPGDEAGLLGSRDRQKQEPIIFFRVFPRSPLVARPPPSLAWKTRGKKALFRQAIFFMDSTDAIFNSSLNEY